MLLNRKSIYQFFLCFLLLLFGLVRAEAQIQIEGTKYCLIPNSKREHFEAYIIVPQKPFTLLLEGDATTFPMTYSSSLQTATRVPNAFFQEGKWHIPSPQLNKGYFVPNSKSKNTNYFWLIDYKNIPSDNEKLEGDYSSVDPCSSLIFNLNPRLEDFYYISPEGIRVTVQRIYTISFNDLKWEEENRSFSPFVNKQEITCKNGSFSILSSLEDSKYTIEKDQFSPLLENAFIPISSDILPSKRLDIHPYCYLKNDNEKKSLGKELSAPAEIICSVIANENVASLYSWSIYKGSDRTTAPLIMQFNGKETLFTLNEIGLYSVFLDITSRDGGCSKSISPISFQIQNSLLEVPNAFSPHSSKGINDIFRVRHQSIVSFHAIIFNEWGEILYQWKDPNKGWDGSFRGALVPGGVYYYSIKAKGADGKKYNLKGNINILQSDLQQQMPNL